MAWCTCCCSLYLVAVKLEDPTDRTKANVMLSYPIPEAESLLLSKLDAAQSSLENCEEDLDFLREQITVRFTSAI